MNKRFIHIAYIFKTKNTNYNDSVGNMTELKKIISNNHVFSKISKHCYGSVLYSYCSENYGWNEEGEPYGIESNVIQALPDATIEKFAELDFKGYLKTTKGGDKDDQQQRSTVLNITDAISLEPFRSDIEFSSNGFLASRLGVYPNIYHKEKQESLFAISISLELHRVGKDGIIEIPNEQKFERVNDVLMAIKNLYRKAGGEIQSWSPIFIVGGVYKIGNPYFLNALALDKPAQHPQKYNIDIGRLEERWNWDFIVKERNENGEKKEIKEEVRKCSMIGMQKGFFENAEEIIKRFGKDKVKNINGFFEWLQSEVEEFYKKVKV